MRYNSIDEMPEAMRERARKILEREGRGAERPEKTGKKKYGNRVTFVGGVKFDSVREAERYIVLITQLREGKIEKLKLQPEFTITESYRMPDGRLVKAQRYRADFSYTVRESGEYVVEDVKTEATKTRVFINKAKLIYEKYGIDVKLI